MNQKLWSEWDNLEVVVEMPEKNFIAKAKTDDDGPVTLLSHIKADGLTLEKLRPFFDDPKELEKLFKGKITTESLGGECTENSASI